LYQNRSYFGVLRVTDVGAGKYHRLIHGHVLHGEQSLEPQRRREPLAYYTRTGPIGQVFEVFRTRPARPAVAVVGLGAGTLACYAEPAERWDFYEIDPAVARVARRSDFFTFLADSRADNTAVVLGDARLSLQEAPAQRYGLIVLDAFSSDSIPTHLLTREAIQLYRNKLAEGGLLAFHISNVYLDLTQVLGAQARDAGMKCLVRRDLSISPDEAASGKQSSTWAVLAARDEEFATLRGDPRWQPPTVRPGAAVWTDDFSSVIDTISVWPR
jgi:hypothetical protein